MTVKKGAFYSEEELFQISLNRSYEERFKRLMQIIRINKLMENAQISFSYSKIFPERNTIDLIELEKIKKASGK